MATNRTLLFRFILEEVLKHIFKAYFFQQLKIYSCIHSLLIGVELIYNVALVSAVQQSESAVCVSISPPSWGSLGSYTLNPPIEVILEHQAELPVLPCGFPLAICFTRVSVFLSNLISQFIPPPLPHCAHMSVFCICVFVTALELG